MNIVVIDQEPETRPVEKVEHDTRGDDDEPMPSVTERPTAPDGTLIKPDSTTTTAYINNSLATLVVQDVDGNTIQTHEEKVTPPQPRLYQGTDERPSAAYLGSVECCLPGQVFGRTTSVPKLRGTSQAWVTKVTSEANGVGPR